MAGSVVPGAIDAFSGAYHRSVSANTAQRLAAVQEALGMDKLRETMEAGATRRALPGDLAAVSGAKFGGEAAAPQPSIVPSPDMLAGVGAVPVPSPLNAPDGSVSAAGLAGEVPGAAPVTGPSIVPAEMNTAGGPGGMTLGMLTSHPEIGAERAMRLMRTPEGQMALKARGFVSDEDFAKRQQRREAKKGAADKYAEAQKLYQSGNADDVVQALNVEAAGHMLLAQAVDNPERLLTKADDLRKKYLDAFDKKEERTRIGVDMPKLFTALANYKTAQSDPKADKAMASAQLYETLGSMGSKVGQHRADEIAAKLAAGAIEEMKLSPTAAFDRAVAGVLETRREKGGDVGLHGLFQEAAKNDPAAFAQYLGYVMTHGKDIPKPLLGLLGLGDVPTDPVHMADNIVVQVEGIPRGSAKYYTRLREVSKEIVHEQKPQFAAEARKTESMARDSDVRLHKQLQDQVKDAQRAIKDAGGEELATPEQRDELAASRDRLRAHESSMVDKKYLAPGVREAGKNREAQGPPEKPTKEAAKAELERLIGQGDTLESAKEKMRRKGWK